MRCCTVHIRYADGDRFCSAFEVRTYRSSKDTELILSCRFYTNNRINTKHIRTNIQRCSASIRRYICCICFYNIYNCLYKTIFRKYRHLQSSLRICHTFCVQIRAEGNDFTLLGCISFNSLKTGLCILKYTCTFTHGNHWIVNQSTFIPCSIFIVGNKSLIGWHISKAKVAPVNVFLFHHTLLPFLCI